MSLFVFSSLSSKTFVEGVIAAEMAPSSTPMPSGVMNRSRANPTASSNDGDSHEGHTGEMYDASECRSIQSQIFDARNRQPTPSPAGQASPPATQQPQRYTARDPAATVRQAERDNAKIIQRLTDELENCRRHRDRRDQSQRGRIERLESDNQRLRDQRSEMSRKITDYCMTLWELGA